MGNLSSRICMQALKKRGKAVVTVLCCSSVVKIAKLTSNRCAHHFFVDCCYAMKHYVFTLAILMNLLQQVFDLLDRTAAKKINCTNLLYKFVTMHQMSVTHDLCECLFLEDVTIV